MPSRAKLSLVSTALALALGAGAAWSQPGGAYGSGGSNPAAGSASSRTSSSVSSANSLSPEDRDMIEDLAEASLADIETSQLALSKSQNPQVRDYAQKMINDHGVAQQELQQMAQARGMTLPQETDLVHKTVAGALRLLSGDTFDAQYINRVGVDDHRRTVELLQKAQGQARDAEFKALAGRMLPVVQSHLDMARQISQQREQREQRQDRQEERQKDRQEERQERQENRSQQQGGGMGSGTR